MPSLQVAARRRVDLVLFPELAIAPSYIKYLRDWSQKNNAIVVAGSHYVKRDEGWVSTSPLIVEGVDYHLEKVTPAPVETSGIPQAGAVEGKRLVVFRSSRIGNFGVLICSDYLDTRVRNRFIEEDLDILCVISFQHDSAPYHSRMSNDCSDSQDGLYVVYCNLNAIPHGDGRSAVFGSMHHDFRAQLIDQHWTDEQYQSKLIEVPSVARYLVAELDLSTKKPRVPRTVRDRANVSIVDTDCKYSESLQAFRRFRHTRSRYRMVVFDLDGTLIRGEKFGWTLVWKYLGEQNRLDSDLQKYYMRRYRRQKFLHNGERISAYAKWCEDVVGLFSKAGLRRQEFRAISARARLTKNLERTLAKLRGAGILTFIISGGIDLLLYEMLPNVKSLVDGVDINVMKLRAPDDAICGVVSTKFDFEGKLVRVEELCYEHGLDLEDVVFVGDAFNDEAVITNVGLGIAYSESPDGDIAGTCPVVIKDDDLEAILPFILSPGEQPAAQVELFSTP